MASPLDKLKAKPGEEEDDSPPGAAPYSSGPLANLPTPTPPPKPEKPKY